MYLKTLELQGFKSFPDKTVIEFDKGMTAIVGANGSGKSNISDAVRWVLGEMSAKSLRGSKMEDVIFNGSSRRKPANFAEVIMTIDNSDFLMKIDYDEVSVGRRLYRSGESEYTINRKPCRLKDVVDLFLNTGIGREGYSVISQGKIAEIVSMKGNDRRELFEEAAGISRFRYRKNEAVQKLAGVSDNAVRINDILSEVQGRIPRLEAQSAKAEIYLAVAEEKKTLELGLWAKRIGELEARRKEDAASLASQGQEVTALGDEIAAEDAKLDSLYVETQEKQLESERKREEIASFAGEVSDLTAHLSALENEVHNLDARLKETEKTGEVSEERLAALAEEEKAAQEEFSRLQGELEVADGKKQKNTEEEAALGKEFSRLFDREEALLAEKDEWEKKAREAALARKEDEGYAQAREERILLLENEVRLDRSRRGEKESRLEALEQEEKKAEEHLLAEKKTDGELNLALYKLGEEAEEISSLLQNAKLSRMEAEQRRNTLLRMERLLEGFSDSVKEIMSAAGKELSGICGPVSKIVSTDEEYVLAIETALAGGVQHIVVEDENAAKRAIAFLKNNRFGRATFLPLTTVRGQVYRTEGISHPGFVGVASDLCRCEEKYLPALEYLLGKTLVCDNIDSAAAIARQEKYGVKIVTLDGQVIHAGGSFTGGQAQHQTGVLSRTSDLERLKEAIAEAEQKITSLSARLEKTEEERRAKREELARSQKRQEEAKTLLDAARNATLLEKERLSEGEEKIRKSEEELESLTLARREKESRAAALQAEEQNALAHTEEVQKALDALEKEREELEKKREEKLLLSGELKTALAAAQLKLENAARVIDDIARRRDDVHRADREKDELSARLRADRETALLAIEEAGRRREEFTEKGKAAREELGVLTARIGTAGEESARLRQEQKEKIARKEKLVESFSRLEARLHGMEKERENIRRELWENYEYQPDDPAFLALAETDTVALGGEEKLFELRKKIRQIGPVNLESVAELKEAKERFNFLNTQYADIIRSKEELEQLITELETTMREMFSETFEKIRTAFRTIFTELFGGGDADIELTDKEDLLNCGVEIKVQPPGKVIKNLSLLSGGEQAFVAIALYMSLLQINPSPFCIFDEIESALDEANVRRYAEYIKKHNDKTQFIVITHRRGTMEEADTLYGIVMQEKGVSDFIRLGVGEIGNFTEDKA